MRRLILNLSLLALAAVPLAARASDMITITQVGNSADSYSFIVPTTTNVAPANTDGSTYFNLLNIPTMLPTGAPYNGVNEIDTVSFYTPAYGVAGLEDNGPLVDIIFYGTQLYSSFSNDVATFAPGSGTILGYDLAGNAPTTFNYTIAATNVTPEPSSLILLGTGALGLVGSMRRRLLA